MSSQRARGAPARDARAAVLLDACVAAARTAGDFIGTQDAARDSGALDWHAKQRADFVSEVDTGAEIRIRDVLVARVPGAIVLGEELSPEAALSGETVFIVDPP